MGIIEVLIGFWAVGYPGRSIILLVIWVGATAPLRRASRRSCYFALHGLRNELVAG